MTPSTPSTPSSRPCRALIAVLFALLTSCQLPESFDGATEQHAAYQGDARDLESLQKIMDVVNHAYYGDTFPAVTLRWTDGPADAFAYTNYADNTIAFVAPNFGQNWTYAELAMRHEMAHYAVGPGHEHDEVWAAEFQRLQQPAVPIPFEEVRARSAQ